jgi:hypothetical protein
MALTILAAIGLILALSRGSHPDWISGFESGSFNISLILEALPPTTAAPVASAALPLSPSAVTTRDSRVIDIGRTHICALADGSTPGTSRGAFGFNERLEPLEIALGPVLNDVELVSYILHQTFRIVLQREIYPGLLAANVFERDGASIRGPFSGCPRDLLVRHLFQDLRLPLTTYTGDFGNPVQTLITELLDALDTLHELRKILKLRPLVVCGIYWNIYQHRFLDLCSHDILLVALLSARSRVI